MSSKLFSSQWTQDNLLRTKWFEQSPQTELFTSSMKNDLLHSCSTQKHLMIKPKLFFFLYSEEHLLQAYLIVQFTLNIHLILTDKILLHYLNTPEMAETFFPHALPDLAMKTVIMSKPQSLQNNKKFSETLRLQFTFWNTLPDLHKQAHAHTHKLFCIPYKYILFS